MVRLEKSGRPTVAIVARTFEEDARRTAATYGIPDLPIALVAECLTNCPPERIRDFADRALEGVAKSLTRAPIHEAGADIHRTTEPLLEFESADPLEAVELMNRRFLVEGWGDGFPLTPPTRRAVDEMLRGSTLRRDEVVGVLEPGLGRGTVEAIAINAVMAGCRPEHLPVVIAATRAMTDPLFRLRVVGCSTGPHTPMLVVNGPIGKTLGINARSGCFGPGAPSYANTVIGRAMRLVLMNVGHSYLGKTDMDSMGSPNKYSMCIAENEAQNPWQPFHMDRGFARTDSTVTVFVAYNTLTINDPTDDPAKLLDNVATAAVNLGKPAVGRWILEPRLPRGARDANRAEMNDEHYLVILGPDHARLLAAHGFTKPGIREVLHVKARIPFWKGLSGGEHRAELRNDWKWLVDHPDTPVPIARTPESLCVVVAGGDGPKSFVVGGGHHAITVPIES